MTKPTVLFICVHNSARSQMAEGWLRTLCGERFEADSAGLEPGELSPLAVEVMREAGVDISGHRPESVMDKVRSQRHYSYVITVCDESAAERCPVFPGAVHREHWSFPDPAAIEGSHETRLSQVREVRDAIRRRIEDWCGQVTQASGSAAH